MTLSLEGWTTLETIVNISLGYILFHKWSMSSSYVDVRYLIMDSIGLAKQNIQSLSTAMSQPYAVIAFLPGS